MPKRVNKVPVSTRAVVQRINRKLAPQDQKMRKSSSERLRNELGEYYIVDVRRNFVVNYNFDLEELGRELNALREWEIIVDE